ncbi:four helix bundle protein [Arcticibacter sp. MXS-1]|uniref:four helix bundle protein n=1 Tax=Arcticibacter sp. MXS-1 TaxID=3341726 RepID=UPI0035A99163
MAGKSILQQKSFDFAIEVVAAYKYLVELEKEFVLSKQLLRSGTAVGALVREAQNAESKPDFIHKLSIAQKETDESLYWLDLLSQSGYLESPQYEGLRDNADGLLRMLRSSIITTREKYISNK